MTGRLAAGLLAAACGGCAQAPPAPAEPPPPSPPPSPAALPVPAPAADPGSLTAEQEERFQKYLDFELPFRVKELGRPGAPAAEEARLLLAERGPGAREPLVEGLLSDDLEVKIACIELLGRLGDPDNNVLLVEQMDKEKNYRVLHAALLALAPADEDLTDPILRAVVKGDPDVRRTAQDALAQTTRMRDIPNLLDWLKKTDPDEDQWEREVEAWRAEAGRHQGDRPPRRATYRDLAVAALQRMTGEAFGHREDLWREWWTRQKDAYQTPADRAIAARRAAAAKSPP